jgi:hypothetical protein
MAMEVVELDGGVLSAMKNSQFAVTAGMVLLVLLAVNTLAGCMSVVQLVVGCFRCSRLCWRFCCKFVGAVMLKGSLPPKVQMVNKKVQSPTTYTMKSAAPRFKPLGEYDWGAWDD